jgi:hypothetical protein
MQKQKIATLRIVRAKSYYAMLRGLVVRIDGERVGDVRNNSVFEIDLMPGEYSVEVRMDWCGSKPFVFHIMEGQILTLHAVLTGGYFGAMFNSYFNWQNLYQLVPATDKSKRKNSEPF